MAFDVDYPRTVLLGLVVIVVLALGVAASTSAVSFGVYNSAWDGASELQDIASEQGVEAEIVTNVTAYETVEPERSVALVLSPSSAYGLQDRTRIRNFVEAGGTLVVAEDFGPHSNALLEAVGADARVDGRLLRDERNNYRSPALPLATNVTGGMNASVSNGDVTESVNDVDLTEGVDELTLNYGTAIQPGNSTVLVWSSPYAYLDADRDEELDDDETLGNYPVVTEETIEDGRVLVVSDPSVFINVMLDRPGNRRFVGNVLVAERVILDYSHAGSIPPLMIVALALRESVLLQLLVGFGGLLVLAGWAARPGFLGRLLGRWRQPTRRGRGQDRGRGRGRGGSRDESASNYELDREQLTAYVRETHPEWDETRVRRIVRAIKTQRDERGDDD